MHTHQITSHSVCIMHIIAYVSVPELLHKVHLRNEQIRVTAHKSLRTSARHMQRYELVARTRSFGTAKPYARRFTQIYVCLYVLYLFMYAQQ